MATDVRNNNALALNERFVSDVCRIINNGRHQAYAAVGQVGIMTFGNVGRRIVEDIVNTRVHNLDWSHIRQKKSYEEKLNNRSSSFWNNKKKSRTMI